MAIRIESAPRNPEAPKPKRLRARPLARHVISSDNHPFVGRIFDLSVVAYHFDSYEDLARYPDCKYAFDVNHSLTGLTRRVESLNLVGDMLWPERLPKDFKDFPVSRYEWLMIAADTFLMRFVSVVDCALILANDVYEAEIDLHKCSVEKLKKAGVPSNVISIFNQMRTDQGHLRPERNERFHHGTEREFTDHSVTFQMASRFERWGRGVRGHDQHGRRINLERSFNEGLVELQREFNVATRKLIRHLDTFYSLLEIEFESRFMPLIRAATHGLNGRAEVPKASTE